MQRARRPSQRLEEVERRLSFGEREGVSWVLPGFVSMSGVFPPMANTGQQSPNPANNPT